MTFKEYQEKARTTAIYPSILDMVTDALEQRHNEDGVADKIRKILKTDPVASNPYYTALGLVGEAGEVADKIKKIMRDDAGYISKDKKKELMKELGDVMWYLSNLSSELGLDLNLVADTNLEKLFSRKDRGVLGGSGDNR